MKNAWDAIKAGAARVWARIKKWGVAVLAAVGLVSVPLLASAVVQFSWTNPTLNEDGSALDPSQLIETRLYCGVDAATFVPQADTTPASAPASAVFPAPAQIGDHQLSYGRHDCFATTVASYDGVPMESRPSNVVTKIVTPPRPNAPVLAE